jgi:hypothetical protein
VKTALCNPDYHEALVYSTESSEEGRVAPSNSVNPLTYKYAATPNHASRAKRLQGLTKSLQPTNATTLLPILLLQYVSRVIYSSGAHCPPIKFARADRGGRVSLSATL